MKESMLFQICLNIWNRHIKNSFEIFRDYFELIFCWIFTCDFDWNEEYITGQYSDHWPFLFSSRIYFSLQVIFVRQCNHFSMWIYHGNTVLLVTCFKVKLKLHSPISGLKVQLPSGQHIKHFVNRIIIIHIMD